MPESSAFCPKKFKNFCDWGGCSPPRPPGSYAYATIIYYHQLSFSLSLFKFFMIVDDSFSRLTTHIIVHDSFSVSYFGKHWPVRKHAAALFRREKIILKVCLAGHDLVFAFLHGKSLELAALVTLLARLSVNYRQLSRTSLAWRLTI